MIVPECDTDIRNPLKSFRFFFLFVLSMFAVPFAAAAQFLTVGGGVLVTEDAAEPVAELHAETPPFSGARAYATLSWTDVSVKPTVITAVERPVLSFGAAFTGLEAGLLWIEPNDYAPYPMLVSSTVVPLPVPKTSFVLIASTLPFEDFSWSLVLKVGFTLLFIR
jgi:hypothetical protein